METRFAKAKKRKGSPVNVWRDPQPPDASASICGPITRQRSKQLKVPLTLVTNTWQNDFNAPKRRKVQSVSAKNCEAVVTCSKNDDSHDAIEDADEHPDKDIEMAKEEEEIPKSDLPETTQETQLSETPLHDQEQDETSFSYPIYSPSYNHKQYTEDATRLPENEYSTEIMQYGKELERRHVFHAKSLFTEDIRPHMRAVLLDWLIQVQAYLKLEDRTLQVAAKLVDRVLGCTVVQPKNLQLLGIASMWVASKLVDCKVPKVNRILQLAMNTYSRQELYEYERVILISLGFELAMAEASLFLDYYLMLVEEQHRNVSQLRHLSMYALDIMLPTVLSAVKLPSSLAAAALYTGQLIIMQSAANIWSSEIAKRSEYKEEDLLPTSKRMLEELSIAPTSCYKGAYTKYNSARYNNLSNSPDLEPSRLRAILKTRFSVVL